LRSEKTSNKREIIEINEFAVFHYDWFYYFDLGKYLQGFLPLLLELHKTIRVEE